MVTSDERRVARLLALEQAHTVFWFELSTGSEKNEQPDLPHPMMAKSKLHFSVPPVCHQGAKREYGGEELQKKEYNHSYSI